jgi:hypothetical protein
MFPPADSIEAPAKANQRAAPPDVGRTSFAWSVGKIRVAAFVLLGAAMPAVLGFAASGLLPKCLSLAWLLGVAYLMHLLSRRASSETVVLTIDQHGILDRRLMSKRIGWHEIEAICPVDIGRSHVVDLKLRWPETTLAKTRWPVRIGAACQRGYGIPAVTISMVLLKGHVSELLDAVARHRPDLLHSANRRIHQVAYR